MWLVEAGDAADPPRARTVHKWSAGSVLVLGGSEGMVGAAVFAARAALGSARERSASPHRRRPPAQASPPRSCRTGPGRSRIGLESWWWGRAWADDTAALEAALASGRPLVIDADALGCCHPTSASIDRWCSHLTPGSSPG
jgi:ADP-dependent NAD(P)H-hydrate dehydratase / NAD(P)H-hydrate epimerase